MLKAIDLCAGTGAFSYALEKTKKVEIVLANDLEPNSKKIYDNNFNHNLVFGDLMDIKNNEIPNHDILTAGFPCQSFSLSGKKQGFKDDRSFVFFKIIEIMELRKPKVVIFENVKNLVSHDNGKTFETVLKKIKDASYFVKYKVLDTAEITGIPQHRERIFIVCFRDKKICDKFNLDFKQIKKNSINDFLEKKVDDKYYYKDHLSVYNLCKKSIIKKNTIYQYRRTFVRENKSNECPTLTKNMGSGGHNVPLLLDDKGIRKLTPRECFNLQGFPQSYKFPLKMSDSALYQLAGNAVTVSTVQLIIDRIISLF